MIPVVKKQLESVLSPLKEGDALARLKAWWEGAEYTPGQDAPGSGGEGAGEASAGPPEIEAHLHISQMLWGRGFLGPGPEEFMVNWGEQLTLNKEKTIGFIGVGLGGPARAISKSFDAWITGFERLETVIALGTEQSIMAGMAKKVTSAPIDPAKLDLPENKFHALFAKEEFCFHPNKEKSFAAVGNALKPNGLMLFSDWTLGDQGDLATVTEKCFLPVWGKPHLEPVSVYREALAAAGVEVRVCEPLTDRILDFITEGWTGYRALFQDLEESDVPDGVKAAYTKALAKEADLWANRLEALYREELAVTRFLLMKP